MHCTWPRPYKPTGHRQFCHHKLFQIFWVNKVEIAILSEIKQCMIELTYIDTTIESNLLRERFLNNQDLDFNLLPKIQKEIGNNARSINKPQHFRIQS